ncbi:hypothetical protein [Dactylosporangium sp. NPDC048998]|uniref:hypothetical protein n=1 Tax=Dactylosporangium sp. NPDC048998 TaxID=3363976 RepID=UPI00371FEB74
MRWGAPVVGVPAHPTSTWWPSSAAVLGGSSTGCAVRDAANAMMNDQGGTAPDAFVTAPVGDRW